MRRKRWIALGVLLVLCTAAYFLPIREPAVPAMAGDVSGILSGLTIVVDPGHGGYDQGCYAGGVAEAPLNLEVSLLLRERLESLGAYVVMTREEDVSLVDPNANGNRKKQDMALRKQVADDAGANLLISVHMNYHANSRYSGAQVFFREGSEEGRALSDVLQESLRALDGSNKRAASAGDYYVLGICEAAALVECGFLSNSGERAKLRDAAYQQRLADAVAEGIVAYWYDIELPGG